MPQEIQLDPKLPQIAIVTYEDGSQIRYLIGSGGLMTPGHLWRAITPRTVGQCQHTITFFMPFEPGSMPEVLKVEGCEE
jgi:hypothetical protein